MVDLSLSESRFRPIRRMGERLVATSGDSDAALFYDLLCAGEMIAKVITACVVAGIQDDRERHRYRLEHRLVRANGIGEWASSLDDAIVGPASQQLAPDARATQSELTSLVGRGAPSWQFDAVDALHQVCCAIEHNYDQLPAKVSLRRWFAQFAWLRNRTRGHGAPLPDQCAALCQPLMRSVELMATNASIFSKSVAFIRRNLSGKYRVTALTETAPDFNYLKTSSSYTYPDGVYIHYGAHFRVRLISTDADLSDFFVANGGFAGDGRSYEMLSYVTDEVLVVPATDFLDPPATLPASMTEGGPSLDLEGKSFANLPPRTEDYVHRLDLENELRRVLVDDRHPIVTLQGPGGAGKTSLALNVIRDTAQTGHFLTIAWCSARDIDLLPHGPKVVAPRVLTRDDIAGFFVELMQPSEARRKGFDKIEYLASSLSARSRDAALLFVIDNFETVRTPIDLYRWLDNTVRLPNKILLTTRFRDFKGDYPVEVSGMTEGEFERLVTATAARLKIGDLLTAGYRDELYSETEGHPYVAKVLLGEVANAGRPMPVPRLIADKDAMLDALFDRSFQMISPAAQRVFLTLCNWRSLVPRLAVEAALFRPTNERLDVNAAIETLRRSSLVDITSASDESEFLGVPITAAEFGRRKLAVSAMRSAVEADTDILHSFGATRATDLAHGIERRIDRLFARVAGLARKRRNVDEYLPVLQYVARHFAPAWLRMADLYEEMKGPAGTDDAISAVRQYLEARPDDGIAWRRLARLYELTGDTLGELHALIELAEMRDSPYQEVSAVTSRLNAIPQRTSEGGIDSEERRVLARRLRTVMEGRIGQANATDCSRVAWLCVHLRDFASARAHVERGLALDSNNVHCLRLAERLEGGQP